MTDQVELKQCAHCGAWMPQVATMCASCGTSDVDGARTRGGERTAPGSRPPSLPGGWTVTRALVWANVAYLLWALRVQHAFTPNVSVIQTLIDFSGLDVGNLYAGGYVHRDVFEGDQWWRVFTAFFLHGGLIHIGMNMWVLSRIGPFLEEAVGWARFLVIYLVSGIGSTLAISVWYAGVLHADRVPMMIGASGAIFGILGALATFAVRAGNVRGRALGMRLWRDILMMLGLGLLVPVISNTGHVGGLLPGVAFGFVIGSSFTDRIRPAAFRAWVAVGGILSALTLVAIAHGVHFSLQIMGAR